MGGGKKKNTKKKKTKIRKINPKQFDSRRDSMKKTTTTKKPSNNKKTLTPAQQRFKDREAAGLDGFTGMRKVSDAERKQGVTQLTQYRAAQTKQVQDAARIRNAAFQAERDVKSGQVPGQGGAMSAEARAAAAAQLAAKREADAKAEAARVKAAEEKNQRMFTSERLSPQDQTSSAISASFTNPAVQNFGKNFGNWYNLGKDTRIANEATAKYGKIGDLFARDTSKVDARTLFGDDRLQRGMSNRAFKEGKQSSVFGRPDRAFGVDLAESFKQRKLVRVPAVEGGPMSGPTPVQRRLISDAFGLAKFAANPKLGILAALAKPTALADGTLTGQPTRFDTQAGGLNIGGSSTEASEGETSGSETGRVVSGVNLKNPNFAPLAMGKEALQGFGDVLTGQRTDFDKLGNLGFGATTDKLVNDAKNMRINSVMNTLENSPIRRFGVGEQFGIDVPDAMNQVRETGDQLKKTFKDFDGKDIDLGNIKESTLKKNVKAEDLRGGISNVLFNLDRMPTLARAASAMQVDSGGGDQEFGNDLRFTFNRDVNTPTGVPGRDLMKSTDPGIVNRILSGKLKDIGQEAITQNNLTGGMNANKFDTLASSINQNIGTKGTIGQTRAAELTALAKRFGPGGAQVPTTQSIIQRTIGGGTRTGSSTSPVRGTGTTGTDTPMEELLIPQTPTYTTPTQTGTDTSNLQQIQQQSYIQNLARLGITDLKSMPQFRANRRTPKRFRSFRRGYF